MSFNARLGLILFFVYLLVYGGFVGISAFKYEWMGKIVFAGLNLAIVYGMALIILAMALAVVYMTLCKSEDEAPTEAAEI